MIDKNVILKISIFIPDIPSLIISGQYIINIIVLDTPMPIIIPIVPIK